MAQPFLKFRHRPKKTGARKRQRVKTQKKRLVAEGVDKALIRKMSEGQIRLALRKTAKAKAKKARISKKK
jgi:hypothetical protein